MRIATKLSIAMSAASALIVGSSGYLGLQQEETDLRLATEHNLQLLSTAIQVAVENAIRDNQSADVREILESLELKDSTIDVLVFDTAGDLIAQSQGGEPSRQIVRQAVHDVALSGEPVVRFDKHEFAVAALAMHQDNGSKVGVLAVVRPLDDMERDLSATRTAVVVSNLTLIAGVSFLGWLLVLVYVRRPLQAVIDAMRSVRTGDLTARFDTARKDEVGDVAVEFDEMVKQLDVARLQVRAETEARQRLEAGLQRIDKLVTVGQLSAGLAHEIGSPLQILNGRARALAAKADLPVDVRRNAQILVEQSERIATIVEQLVGYARKRSPKLLDLDLKVAVAAVVDLVGSEANRRGIRLKFVCDDPLPVVRADPNQVQQVVLNLLNNALRATHEGGEVCVSLSKGPSLFPGSPEPVPAVCLRVEDNGAGIDEDLLGRIFDPFFTTSSDEGGTGLGLAVARSIVDDHGGLIEASSSKGRGSRFSVHLPVTRRTTDGAPS